MRSRISHKTTAMRRRMSAVGASALPLALGPGQLPGPLMPTATSAAAATGDPQHVALNLDGCRNNGTITLPNSDGKFICPDSAYTSGDLGKGWNELDLVPFRITAQAGNSAPASQTYTVAI